MIKKSVRVLAAFFLVFGVGISSSALAKEIMSPEIREAILALRYKNLSAAKKLVRKVEQQLSYSPGGPADRTPRSNSFTVFLGRASSSLMLEAIWAIECSISLIFFA